MNFLKGLLKVIGVLLSIVLAVVIFASTVSAIVLGTVKNSITPDAVISVITESTASAGQSSELPSVNIDELTDELLEQPEIKPFIDSLRDAEVDVDKIIGIIKDDIVIKAVSFYIEGATEYTLAGKTEKILDAAALTTILDDGFVKIKAELEDKVSVATLEHIEDLFADAKDKASELIEEIPSYEEIANQLEIPDDVLEVIRNIGSVMISPYIFWGIIGVIVVSALLIMLFRFSVYRWMCWTAVPMLMASIPTLILSVLGKTASGLTETVTSFNIDANVSAIIESFGSFITSIFDQMLILSVIFLAVSIVLFVLYGVLGSVVRKRKARKN